MLSAGELVVQMDVSPIRRDGESAYRPNLPRPSWNFGARWTSSKRLASPSKRPSAFARAVGRSGPKAGGTPWQAAAPARTSAMIEAARRVERGPDRRWLERAAGVRQAGGTGGVECGKTRWDRRFRGLMGYW